eukprot:5540865-Pleurochrysis_carterae.AAC.1
MEVAEMVTAERAVVAMEEVAMVATAREVAVTVAEETEEAVWVAMVRVVAVRGAVAMEEAVWVVA